MSEMVSQWSDVRFGREEKRGVILGLEKHQLVFVATGMVMTMIVVFTLGFPVGWLAGIPILAATAGLGWTRSFGRSTLFWIGHAVLFLVARANGQNRYLRLVKEESASMLEELIEEVPVTERPVASAGRRRGGRRGKEEPEKPVLAKPRRLMLPGVLNELLIYEMEDGSAFIYDPAQKTGIVAAKVVSTDAFELNSIDEQDDRTEAFSAVLSAFATQPGVAFVQFTDRTSVVSGQRIKDYYLEKGEKAFHRKNADGSSTAVSGKNINPFADKAYLDLVSTSRGIAYHEGWLVLVLSRDALMSQITANGGGIVGFMELAKAQMEAVEPDMAECGAGIDSWMNSRELAACIRTSFDPASAVGISERSGSFAGVAPESAGPMAVRKEWKRLRTDSAFHRTFWVAEWPRRKANPGFLAKLIFAGEFSHSVTLTVQPVNITKATKAVVKARVDWKAGIRLMEKLQRPITESQLAEGEDLEREEEELTNGYGSVKIGGYVSVSAETESDLEKNCTAILSGAARSSVELRVLYDQQDAGFAAAALPLGRGLL